MYDAQGRFDKIYFWDKQGLPEWTFDGSYQFYYTVQPSKIKERNFDSLCNVYPNPCDASLVIESYTGIIEMFNSSGQLVISEQFENGGRINTSSLRKGVYILKFGDVYTTMIMKQ
ncbi:MAG: T9SS type A sorting domain-containing protein [Bacteroidales bacterium]